MPELAGEGGGEQEGKAGQAQEKLQQGKQQLQERAQPLAGQARQKTQEKAQQLRGQAATQVRGQLDTRSNQAGEQVSSVAQAARMTSEQLRNQGQEGPAKVVEQAAERAERLGGYLTNSDGERILSDLEDFARRQPWIVAALGAIGGFLASRFVKASASGGEQSDGASPEIPAWTERGRQGDAPVETTSAAAIDASSSRPRTSSARLDSGL